MAAAKQQLSRPDDDLQLRGLRRRIEDRLVGAGADQVGFAVERARVSFTFRLDGVVFRLTARMPDPDDPALAFTPSGRARTNAQRKSAVAAARAQSWKALAAWVGACVDCAALGVMDLAQAFGWCVVLPDGRTTGEWLIEQLGEAAASGQMPESIPGLPPLPETPALMEVIQQMFDGEPDSGA